MLQVLKETLRLYPTAPGTNRWLHEDMVINGLKIPGGCSVAVSIGSFCSHHGTGPGQLFLVIQVQLLSIWMDFFFLLFRKITFSKWDLITFQISTKFSQQWCHNIYLFHCICIIHKISILNNLVFFPFSSVLMPPKEWISILKIRWSLIQRDLMWKPQSKSLSKSHCTLCFSIYATFTT